MDINLNSQSTTGNNEDESVALCSVPSDGSLRQERVLGHLTSREDETLQEGAEIGVDHRVEPMLSEDCKQMFEAVTRGDFEILSSLLTNHTTKFDAIDSEGNTVLHCAVILACHQGVAHDSYYRCIDVLMNCRQMKLNTPNKDGCTAIAYALNDFQVKCVEHMLKHSSVHRLYLDYYPGDRESTVREIIMDTYPDLQPLLPAHKMETLVSSERDKKLLAALQHDKYNIFCENLDTNPSSNPWYDDPYHSSLLEIACQMKDRKQFVELLLESGADPNIKNRVTGMPLLHATARSGSFEVLEMLLKRQHVDISLKDNKGRTILHWWALVSERNKGDKKRLENCFEHLLKSHFVRRVGIDCTDVSKMTPLSIAVVRENRDRVKLLLKNNADVMACKHARPILESCSTSQLEEILDYCLESNSEPVNSKNLMVKLRYQTLEKMLFLAEVPHHKDLLRHPALSIFLNLMWGKIVKKFVYPNIVFYLIFLLVLTTYILCSEFVDTRNNRGFANSTNDLLSSNDSHTISGMSDATLYNISHYSRYFLMGLLFLLFLREAVQVYVYRKLYIRSLQNWLEVPLIFVIFTSCSGVMDSIEIKRHLFAVAIMLGWLDMGLLLGRLPELSVHAEMLKTVSSTFLRFMKGYVVVLVAFALGFYIIFKRNVKGGDAVLFNNPFISLLRTIVMFTGEFEASSLPFDTLPGTSHVIFVLFVFLVAIVLLNLLNGLAVSDTEEIRKKAETLSLMARVKLISQIEKAVKALPSWMTPSMELTEDVFTLYLNNPNSIGSTEVRSLLRIVSKKRQKSKKQISIEHMEIWSLFTESLCALEKKFEENLQILEKKFDLKFEETHKILKQILSLQEIQVSDKICAES